MITYHMEPSVDVAGKTIAVLSRTQITGVEVGGVLLFSAEKQPVAVVCSGDAGDELFALDSEPIDPAGLQVLAEKTSVRFTQTWDDGAMNP